MAAKQKDKSQKSAKRISQAKEVHARLLAVAKKAASAAELLSATVAQLESKLGVATTATNPVVRVKTRTVKRATSAKRRTSSRRRRSSTVKTPEATVVSLATPTTIRS